VRRSSEYGFMLYMITRSAMWVNGYGVCCRYKLMPHEEEVSYDDPFRDYHKVYSSMELAAQWPVFAKEIEALRVTDIDAKPADPAWNERRQV
jgi:hypothetical protein